MIEILELLVKYKDALFLGGLTTLKITIISWILGTTIGFVLGFISSYFKFIKKIVSFVSFLLSAIPILVILFWFHYPFQYLLGINIEPIYTSIAILSIINIFLIANIVIESLDRFPNQYKELSIVYNISPLKTTFLVEIPFIIRISLPNILIVNVNILHMSLFAGLISVNEMFRTILQINAIEYKPVELFTLLAIFFLIFSIPLLIVSKKLKKKFLLGISEK